MAEIITDDISIYKNGSWNSIKKQQAYVSGGWKTIGEGSGVYYNGNWYVFKTIPKSIEVMTFNNSALGGLSYRKLILVSNIDMTDYPDAGLNILYSQLIPFTGRKVETTAGSNTYLYLPPLTNTFNLVIDNYGCLPGVAISTSQADSFVDMLMASSNQTDYVLTFSTGFDATVGQALWDGRVANYYNFLNSIAASSANLKKPISVMMQLSYPNGIGFTSDQIKYMKDSAEASGNGYFHVEFFIY